VQFNYSYKNINYFVKKIIPFLKNKLILIEGDLGAGKTTLIKEFCKELGCNNPVTSPTFPILNIYNVDKKKIYHADLYRINTFNEFNELGFYEMMEKDDWFFIEWPELLYNLIDISYTKIKIKYVDNNKRIVNLSFHEF
tara:strand:- start:2057 stop:2473 length:417 start_codon:yes stop_codon:yes gene_type:complete